MQFADSARVAVRRVDFYGIRIKHCGQILETLDNQVLIFRIVWNVHTIEQVIPVTTLSNDGSRKAQLLQIVFDDFHQIPRFFKFFVCGRNARDPYGVKVDKLPSV